MQDESSPSICRLESRSSARSESSALSESTVATTAPSMSVVVWGGLGGAVAEVLGEVMPTPLKRLGVQGFGESGDAKGLYAKHGLDPAGIAASVRKFLNR